MNLSSAERTGLILLSAGSAYLLSRVLVGIWVHPFPLPARGILSVMLLLVILILICICYDQAKYTFQRYRRPVSFPGLRILIVRWHRCLDYLRPALQLFSKS